MKKTTRIQPSMIVILIAGALVAACASAPTPTLPSPSPTSAPSTSIPTVPAPTNPAPTTAPAAAATNPVPTTAPSTEAVEPDPEITNVMEANRMNIQIGDTVLTATLADNSSAEALKAALAAGPISINMRDYGSMEKVGSLGMDLPRNDQQITTEAGDIILYQGSAFVIYYAPNSWNFTRLGKIDNVGAQELRDILGDGNVTITLSLP